jgi:hypothetical protein
MVAEVVACWADFCVDDWCELLDYTSEDGLDKIE